MEEQMNKTELVGEFKSIVEKAQFCSEKARREGLLALEEFLETNEVKLYKGCVFEVGIRLVIDGHGYSDHSIAEKILTNIVNLETDSDKKLLKNIEKEAVLSIQSGDNPHLLALLLYSYVDFDFDEAVKKYLGVE
jgi:flagellar motor component MotA